jgi:hypothetical protein
MDDVRVRLSPIHTFELLALRDFRLLWLELTDTSAPPSTRRGGE